MPLVRYRCKLASPVRLLTASASFAFCLQVVAYFNVAGIKISSEEVFGLESDPLAIDSLLKLPSRVLIVEPFHGLGNRLRAYASAAALAKLSSRTLVTVWIPDAHVNAPMSTLFDTTGFTVFDFQISHLLRKVWKDVKYYDYNAKGMKDRVIEDTSLSVLYIRSAYILQSQTRVTELDISCELNRLVPSLEVQQLTDKLKMRLAPRADLVGVHIRMITDITRDVPGIERLQTNDPASSAHMGHVDLERSRCHYAAFVPHIEEAIQKNPRVNFLVASDSPQAIHALRARFSTRIISSDLDEQGNCEGEARRGSSCLQISLAEFLVLSKETSALILSDWSSASELIARYNFHKTPKKIGCFDRKVSRFPFSFPWA